MPIKLQQAACHHCGEEAFEMFTTDSHNKCKVQWCAAGHVVMLDSEGRKKLVGSFQDAYWSE